jgi:type I restriction enzyme, S subunit
MKKNWEIKKLREIGKIFNGNSINEKVKRDKYTDVNEGLSFIATKDISFENTIDYDNGIKIPLKEKQKFKIAPRNTVLICAEGGSAGRKIAFTNQDVCFGNKLFALSVNRDIESRYVYYFYFSSSFQKQFSLNLSGLIGGVSMNKFKEMEIHIPPLNEQKKIVEVLDGVFLEVTKAEENAEKNLKNARLLFQSQLRSIFAQRNGGWEHIVPLASALSVQPRNGWSPPLAFQTGAGLPVLTLSSVTGFEYDGTRVKLSSAPTQDGGHYWLKNDELLITRSNTQELVGHVAIYNGIPKKAICCDLIMKMQVDSKKAYTRFVYYYLRSPEARSYITIRAQGASSTMKKIGKQVVQNIPIPLPSLGQQKSAIEKLDFLLAETKKLEIAYEKKLADLEELKKSILQKAFKGELVESLS